jgi:hypothetical protein
MIEFAELIQADKVFARRGRVPLVRGQVSAQIVGELVELPAVFEREHQAAVPDAVELDHHAQHVRRACGEQDERAGVFLDGVPAAE